MVPERRRPLAPSGSEPLSFEVAEDMLVRSLFSILWCAAALPAATQIPQLGSQLPVTEIALRTEPNERRVRPFETIVIQVKAYGMKDQQKVRLRRATARWRVAPQGGWISKPFAFQGKDDEKFYEDGKSAAWDIFSQAAGQFVVKDCVLYTAPEKPGKYKVEADIDAKRAEVEIEVAADAPSRRQAEKISFPPANRTADPFRPLAEYWAPFLAQETWFDPRADMPVRFDFDGDWDGDNNWDSLGTGSSQAYVHYAAMETETHWFLIYNVFHARDYSDRCVVGTCHENDNEGIILTILKDGSQFGRLQVLETLAHNNVYSYTTDNTIRNGIHNIDGTIEFYEQTHPAVFIESGGHGIYGTRSTHSRFTLERGEFQEGTGITLVYKGTAERPLHANYRLVGYDLLSIYDEWWLKAEEGKSQGRTFDGYFQYQPYGNRPRTAAIIGGTFLGRKESSNKAKPFWGWHDTQTLKKKILSAGQWALDPAYAVSRNLRFPDQPRFSLDYIFNPYLGIDKRAGAAAQPVAQPVGNTAPVVTPTPAASPAPVPIESGQVEITAQVDGTVDLFIAGDKLRWEVHSGQPVMRETAQFSSPLPAAPAGSWFLSKTGGRGSVILAEKPSAENGFTVRIRIEDPRGGADTYRFRLRWGP